MRVTPASKDGFASAEVRLNDGPGSATITWSNLQEGPVLRGILYGRHIASVDIPGVCVTSLEVTIPDWQGPRTFIGVDNRTGPNNMRLTWLELHEDHFHPRGAYTSAGRGAGVIPEDYTVRMVPSATSSSVLTSESSSSLQFRSLSTLQQNVPLLWGISSGRFATDLTGSDIHVVLAGISPGLSIFVGNSLVFSPQSPIGTVLHLPYSSFSSSSLSSSTRIGMLVTILLGILEPLFQWELHLVFTF